MSQEAIVYSHSSNILGTIAVESGIINGIVAIESGIISGSGVMSDFTDVASSYEGETEFTSEPEETIVVPVSGLVVHNDIIINPVETAEVTNDFGTTFIIG